MRVEVPEANYEQNSITACTCVIPCDGFVRYFGAPLEYGLHHARLEVRPHSRLHGHQSLDGRTNARTHLVVAQLLRRLVLLQQRIELDHIRVLAHRVSERTGVQARPLTSPSYWFAVPSKQSTSVRDLRTLTPESVLIWDTLGNVPDVEARGWAGCASGAKDTEAEEDGWAAIALAGYFYLIPASNSVAMADVQPRRRCCVRRTQIQTVGESLVVAMADGEEWVGRGRLLRASETRKLYRAWWIRRTAGVASAVCRLESPSPYLSNSRPSAVSTHPQHRSLPDFGIHVCSRRNSIPANATYTARLGLCKCF